MGRSVNISQDENHYPDSLDEREEEEGRGREKERKQRGNQFLLLKRIRIGWRSMRKQNHSNPTSLIISDIAFDIPDSINSHYY
jgi:hypothetical protein